MLRAVRIPLPLAESTAFYKIAKRRFDDISSVSVAIALQMTDGVVVRSGFGSAVWQQLPSELSTEQAFTEKPWTPETVTVAAAVMAGEGTPINDMRASALYRSAMLRQALMKFHTENVQAVEVAR